MNKIIVSGNLASDVRVGSVNEKTDVINGTLIVDDSYTKDGQRVEQSIAYPFAYFVDKGKTGVAPHMTKGRTVTIEGSLQRPEPNQASNGKTYHDVQIRVDSVELGRKPHAQEAAERAANAGAAA
jgi:single-stranded DNA-binding protein